jgi:hypothetical protein
MQLVRALEALVIQVERIGVLHHELATAQHAGPGPGLVPILGLDLVQDDRVVLIRGVLALHHLGEQLLVRGSEQVVQALAVLEPEDVVAVLGPAPGELVLLAWQQRGEQQLLAAHPVHLLADHPRDVVQDDLAKRQPAVDARRDPADVSGPYQQLVAGHLGVRRILAQGAQEQRRHPGDHG